MKFLALYLRAPLQSWGASSLFGNRESLDAPTRSALIGLIAAACGIDKNNPERERQWLQRASALTLRIYAFRRGERMTDYHTVGGGFDSDNPWQRRMIPTKAESGKPRGTDLTKRDYLTDSVFGAVFSGDPALIDEMARGLVNPVWGIWFGRKCCIPTEPVFAGVFDSAADADSSLAARLRSSLQRANGIIAQSGSDAILFRVVETDYSSSDETLLDIPVSFSQRIFHARTIRRETS